MSKRESTPDQALVSFTTKELFIQLSSKIDTVLNQMSDKASRSEVSILATRLEAIEKQTGTIEALRQQGQQVEQFMSRVRMQWWGLAASWIIAAAAVLTMLVHWKS